MAQNAIISILRHILSTLNFTPPLTGGGREGASLFLNKLQLFGELYPFVPTGYLDGAAFELTEDVGAVVGDSELGIEVFGTVVVDHLKIGFFAVCADINTGDNPYAGVGGLLQVAERIAKDVLPGNRDGFFV